VSGLRAPVVAGVGGGVGTTTVAVALRGHDAGGESAVAADILTCRGTVASLRRAAAVLEHTGPEPRPVLAVTLDGVRSARGVLRAQLHLLEPGAGAVVLLPHVGRWRTLADPLTEVASLLVEPLDRLPRPLRAYAAALRELAGAVATSGRLHAAPARPIGRPAGPAAPRWPARNGPPTAPASAATPRIVGAFRPVVGSTARGVARALPDPHHPGPAAGQLTRGTVGEPRGVRIIAPPGRSPVASGRVAGVPGLAIERAEQVG
jgi:hypothetical protein